MPRHLVVDRRDHTPRHMKIGLNAAASLMTPPTYGRIGPTSFNEENAFAEQAADMKEARVLKLTPTSARRAGSHEAGREADRGRRFSVPLRCQYASPRLFRHATAKLLRRTRMPPARGEAAAYSDNAISCVRSSAINALDDMAAMGRVYRDAITAIITPKKRRCAC